MKVLKLTLAALALATAASAQATLISGIGSPDSAAELSGGTVIDFDSQAAGNYNNLWIDGVTFTGVDAPFTIGGDYNGDYNTSGGQSIYNDFDYVPLSFRFDFDSVVDAFGFNWGASDYNWTLSAFDSIGGLLESVVIAPVSSSNLGDFFGIAASGISYATLSTDSSDYVFIDNFTYSSSEVPEPSGLLLLGLGLLGLGYSRKILR